MLHAIQTLIAGIEAGAITDSEWQKWAEAEMARSTPTSWLADLTTTSDPSIALGALADGWRRYRGDDQELDGTSLLIGFLYEQHLVGFFNLSQVLSRIGRAVDDRNYDAPNCEAVFTLANELDAACGYEPMVMTVAVKADSMFKPHLDCALRARLLLTAGPN